MSIKKTAQIESHINFFLSSLPANLGLERVLGLDLSNPAAALSTLIEVRRDLEAERRKAQALGALSNVNLAAPKLPEVH